MQHDRERWIGMEHLAVHFHVVARGWLRTEIRADLAVDGDSAGCDQLIAMTPRTHAGGGKETIEAQGKLNG